MKLAAKYKKPTIVARLNDQGYDRGSIRGVNNSPLESFKDFLTESGYFEYVQGHANAAGCSILDKDLSNFHKYANERLKDVDFGESCYDVNFIRRAADADIEDLIVSLGSADGIWGQANLEPIICVQDVHVNPSNIRVMGANSDTLKIEYNGIAYMKFHAKDLIEELKNIGNNATMTIVGRANLNNWMGRITPQLFIENYEIIMPNDFEF